MISVERVVLAAPLLALAAWRLFKGVTIGSRLTLHRFSSTGGIISSGDTALIEDAAIAASQNVARAVRVASFLAAISIWVAGNILLWCVLFRLPFERDIPPLWLAFVDVFANFYLMRFAARGGRRWAQRFQSDPSGVG